MNRIHNVAWFGGAFDPPTLGHQTLMMAVRVQTGMPVCMSPCYIHRFDKKMASPNNRTAMCLKLIDHMSDYFSVSSEEISDLSQKSTYEYLNILKARYPHILFHLVIGSDNLEKIKEWAHWEYLLAENPLIIVTRPDYEIDETILELSKNHKIVKHYWEGSSSKIRKWIQDGKYDLAERNLHPDVWNYITENKLYGYKNA